MFVSLLAQKSWQQMQIYDTYPIRKVWESAFISQALLTKITQIGQDSRGHWGWHGACSGIILRDYKFD